MLSQKIPIVVKINFKYTITEPEKMRFYIWQILLVLVFVFAVKAEQNDQNFLQTQWTTENGLSNDYVRDIYE